MPSNSGTSTSMEKADPFLGGISSACLLTFVTFEFVTFTMVTIKSVCEKYGFRPTVNVIE